MFERFKNRPADPDRTDTTGRDGGTGNGRTGNGHTAVADRPAEERTATPGTRRAETAETAGTAGTGRTAGTAEPATSRHEPHTREPHTRDQMRATRARQREEFGGVNWGAAFFGWLVAVGLGSLLVAIVAAAGAVVGLTEISESDAAQNAESIGVGGGILLLAVLMIAYYCGGYVAGRMSRFDGARQGFGAWLFGIAITILLALAAVILGSEYNVLEQLNLPSVPVGESTLTTGGAIALAAVVLGSLLAAVVGGKAGERYHRKVDRAGIVD